MAARRSVLSQALPGAAALLVALAAAPLWGDLAALARAWNSSYAERREALALQLPAAQVADFLDRRLAPAPALLLPVLAISAAIAGIFVVTPMDLAWHVGYAFDRLAIHPGLLAVIAATAVLAPAGSRV